MAMPQTPPLSAAGQQLGLGSLLADQVSNETDEIRKRRLAALQAGGGMGLGLGDRAALASPISSLFGNRF